MFPAEPSQPGAAPALLPDVENGGEGGPATRGARDLGRYYTYQFVADINLVGGTWILYLQDRGLSLAQIGLAEACFHLAPIALGLPFGSLADTFGRKWSLAVGALLVAVSAALMLVARSVWLVLPAMFLSGASFAFRSGAQQAFLYDALAERETTGGFSRLLGRLLSVSYVVIAATTWLGAALTGKSFAWPYALTVGVGLAAAYLAAGLHEPARERTEHHRSMRRTIGAVLRIVGGRSVLEVLLGFAAALWTLLTLIGLYAQAVLAERGLDTPRIGLVIGASLLCTAVGSWFAHRQTARGAFPLWTVAATAAIVGGGLGLGGGALALAVGAYLLAEFVAGIYEPLLAARVNADVGAAQRATILSVQGFLFSVTMIWAFPLVGWVAGRFGWLAAYAGAGGVVIVLLVTWLLTSTGGTSGAGTTMEPAS